MKIFTVSLCIIAILAGSKAAPGIWERDFEKPGCQAPNGGGLQGVLDEFTELVEVDKLIQIYITAVSSDPEVQEAMEYLSSDDVKNIILAIQNAPKFYDLMEYSCEKLYFDAYYYYNQFADLFGLPKITKPPFNIFKKTETEYRRSGLKGMFLDMYDVLPVDEIQKLFEEKLKTDEYVKLAMEFLASDDFKEMVKLVESQNEYEKVLEKLRKMDIDIDTIIKVVKKFFKWD